MHSCFASSTWPASWSPSSAGGPRWPPARLPVFAVTYLSGLARWNARISGYMFLLTDVYPPFSLDDPAYPLVIAIPERGRLNRPAVLFRLVLGVWAGFVLSLVTGWANTIVLFIAWLITLITGKLPTPLHLALTAVLRYQTRYSCYLYLLTPTYPWKLFGDEPAASDPVTAASAEAVPPAEFTESVESVETPTPTGWHLVLPRSAKNLLIVLIALGLLGDVGYGAEWARLRDAGNDEAQWHNAVATLNANMEAWSNAMNVCQQSQNLACAEHWDAKVAYNLSSFVGQVRTITLPPDAAASAAQAQVVADGTKSAQDFTTVSQATTVGQYDSAQTTTGLQQDLNRLSADVSAVSRALDKVGS
jgi:hypothetical protein